MRKKPDMLLNQNVNREYGRRINTVINFILKNTKEELSLKKLASIANYSTFHFQKLFKQVTGESPKQFIIRIRLENSAHYLLSHRHKPVSEIALDSGFSSPSTFARAFKKYLGISADELRHLTPKRHISLRRQIRMKKKTPLQLFPETFNEEHWKKNLKINVEKMTPFRILFANSPLSDVEKIENTYKNLIRSAEVRELLTTETKFIGVINPHAGLYQAAITIQAHQIPPKDIASIEIEGGKFAVYKVKGDVLQTFHAFHAFYQFWLPESWYRIKQLYAFEFLLQNPLAKPYRTITREIYIPIEPA